MPPAMMLRLKVGATGSIDLNDNELPSIERFLESPPCSPTVNREALIFQPAGHPKQAMFDEEIWPPIFKPEFVRSAKCMKPRDSDVFVCTYPKCGTTWIQHICSQLMLEDYGPDVGRELCVTSPMIERMGAKFAENVTAPRLLKSHFAFKNMPKSAKAKYIFACRNPKDCLTSYYHHNRNFKIYNFADGDFDTFFELFAAGKLGFGDYFEHLLTWLPHINDENVLFLKYEDMCADQTGTVVKIAKFLGGRAAELVEIPEQLREIVDASSLQAMKQNQRRWFPEANMHKENFIRKGGSGDWRNHMSREQSDRLDAIFADRMRNTVAALWWEKEMRWSKSADENNNGE